MTDIYDDEQNDDCAFTKKDYEELARTYLTIFFKTKTTDDGSEVECEDLHTKRNIFLVLNLNVCAGMPIIYRALNAKQSFSSCKGNKIPEDILLVLKLLNECARMGMPKDFAAGLVAVYFELCRGCRMTVTEEDLEDYPQLEGLMDL